MAQIMIIVKLVTDIQIKNAEKDTFFISLCLNVFPIYSETLLRNSHAFPFPWKTS